MPDFPKYEIGDIVIFTWGTSDWKYNSIGEIIRWSCNSGYTIKAYNNLFYLVQEDDIQGKAEEDE